MPKRIYSVRFSGQKGRFVVGKWGDLLKVFLQKVFISCNDFLKKVCGNFNIFRGVFGVKILIC